MISLFLPAANPTYELLWAGHSATNSAINVFGEIVKCRWVLKGKYHLSMVFLLVPQRTQPLQHRREDNLPEMLPLTGIMPITTIQSFSRCTHESAGSSKRLSWLIGTWSLSARIARGLVDEQNNQGTTVPSAYLT